MIDKRIDGKLTDEQREKAERMLAEFGAKVPHLKTDRSVSYRIDLDLLDRGLQVDSDCLPRGTLGICAPRISK